jgi:hypothetical protein
MTNINQQWQRSLGLFRQAQRVIIQDPKQSDEVARRELRMNLVKPLPSRAINNMYPHIQFPKTDTNTNVNLIRYSMEREAIAEQQNASTGEPMAEKYGVPINPAYGTKLMQLANNLKYECSAYFSGSGEVNPDALVKITKIFNELSLTYQENTQAIVNDKIFHQNLNVQLVQVEVLAKRVIKNVSDNYDTLPEEQIRKKFREYNWQDYRKAFNIIEEGLANMIAGRNISGYKSISNEPATNTLVTLNPSTKNEEEPRGAEEVAEEGDEGGEPGEGTVDEPPGTPGAPITPGVLPMPGFTSPVYVPTPEITENDIDVLVADLRSLSYRDLEGRIQEVMQYIENNISNAVDRQDAIEYNLIPVVNVYLGNKIHYKDPSQKEDVAFRSSRDSLKKYILNMVITDHVTKAQVQLGSNASLKHIVEKFFSDNYMRDSPVKRMKDYKKEIPYNSPDGVVAIPPAGAPGLAPPAVAPATNAPVEGLTHLQKQIKAKITVVLEETRDTTFIPQQENTGYPYETQYEHTKAMNMEAIVPSAITLEQIEALVVKHMTIVINELIKYSFVKVGVHTVDGITYLKYKREGYSLATPMTESEVKAKLAKSSRSRIPTTANFLAQQQYNAHHGLEWTAQGYMFYSENDFKLLDLPFRKMGFANQTRFFEFLGWKNYA